MQDFSLNRKAVDGMRTIDGMRTELVVTPHAIHRKRLNIPAHFNHMNHVKRNGARILCAHMQSHLTIVPLPLTRSWLTRMQTSQARLGISIVRATVKVPNAKVRCDMFQTPPVILNALISCRTEWMFQ